MRDKPLLIFGAGATKDCGGPLTNEILFEAFKAKATFERQDLLERLGAFLRHHFPHVAGASTKEDYPALPLVFSLLDTAIDRRQQFGPNWPPDELARVREDLEYAIFGLFDNQLRSAETNSYLNLLDMTYPGPEPQPAVISFNYDIVLDRAAFFLCSMRYPDTKCMPDYGCDIRTPAYRNCDRHYGRLLKLHGSLNWIYCPGCHRMDVGMSKRDRFTPAVRHILFDEVPLDERFTRTEAHCRDCSALLRPVLITPTYRKDYRNPHIAQVWYQAERELQQANRIIIVGYSLPDDDVEVAYLLKRGLAGLPPQQITVVEKDDAHRSMAAHPVGQRYRALFGDLIDFRTEGFSTWLGQHQAHKLSPVTDRLPKPDVPAAS